MSREKALTTEERILWGKVARTARPMPGRMEEILQFEAALAEPVEPEVAKLPPGKKQKATAATEQPQPAGKPVHRHHPLERPTKKKLAHGRLPLEARIDLHGLIQSEAHALLHGFLQRAHERGLRHVLVITGKGSSMGSDGALKRAVPMWFSKPEFRYLISSHEPAAQNHGGDGALYVRLARSSGDKA